MATSRKLLLDGVRARAVRLSFLAMIGLAYAGPVLGGSETIDRVVRTALGDPIIWPGGAQVVISDEAPDWVETATREALTITRQILGPAILDGTPVALPSLEPIVQPYPMAFIEYVEVDGPVAPATLEEPSPRAFVIASSQAQAGDRELGVGDFEFPLVSTIDLPANPKGDAVPCVTTVFSVGDILAYAHIRIGPIDDPADRSACLLGSVLAAAGLDAGADLIWNAEIFGVERSGRSDLPATSLSGDPAVLSAVEQIRTAYDR